MPLLSMRRGPHGWGAAPKCALNFRGGAAWLLFGAQQLAAALALV